MSMLLAQMGKNTTASKRKVYTAAELGVSDSDDEEEGAKPVSKSKFPSKMAKKEVHDLLASDDSDSMGDEGGDGLGETFEEEKKRLARSKVDILMAEIDRNAKSPTEMPKNVSKGRGRKGRGRSKNSASPVKDNDEDAEIKSLLASVDADKKEKKRKKRIEELEDRLNDGNDADVELLDLPDIPTAKERESSKPKRDSLETINLLTDELQVTSGNADIKGLSDDDYGGMDLDMNVDGDEGREGAGDCDGGGDASFAIKTRLNGKHEHLFQFAETGTWEDFRKMVSEYYSLTGAAGLKVKFDGGELKGKGTPEDEDMESGDLVDLTVNDSAYNGAVGAAKKMAAASSNRKVKFKTRLNGTHEHKWMVGEHEPFKKIKEKFASFYGIKPSQVKRFEFDGEVIANDATPADLEMEDGELVDVTVTAPALDKAIAHAEASKQANGKPATSSSSSSSSSSTSSSAITGSGSKKAREDRMEITLELEVLDYVSRKGETQTMIVKQFADCKVDTLRNILIHKAKLVRADKDVIFTLMRPGQGSTTLNWELSLIDNKVFEGSKVQIRPPNINITFKPSGISADAKGKYFVGEFTVKVNPVKPLSALIMAVLQADHLKHPREELKFSLIPEKGAARELDLAEGSDDWRAPLLKVGFFDHCEVLVEKR